MADNRMGALADEGSYDPFGSEKFANPAVKAVIGGIAAQTSVPGQLMAPNPYPPGSEEAAFYDAAKIHGATEWAPGQALDRTGIGVKSKTSTRQLKLIAKAIRERAQKDDARSMGMLAAQDNYEGAR
jgi:hypothetical protein